MSLKTLPISSWNPSFA
ncbi:hypothetical protein EYA86_06215 [Mediterraneibacter sp. gm002]|nr:hypothetical protein D8Q48_04870 [Ruminococcus sp. B05]TAP34255.1 hypothetical protein EYA86_06215 [Mediterraneibacter sp. gm002]